MLNGNFYFMKIVVSVLAKNSDYFLFFPKPKPLLLVEIRENRICGRTLEFFFLNSFCTTLIHFNSKILVCTIVEGY